LPTEVSCSHCDYVRRFSQRLAGRRFRCPKCKQGALEVPSSKTAFVECASCGTVLGPACSEGRQYCPACEVEGEVSASQIEQGEAANEAVRQLAETAPSPLARRKHPPAKPAPSGGQVGLVGFLLGLLVGALGFSVMQPMLADRVLTARSAPVAQPAGAKQPSGDSIPQAPKHGQVTSKPHTLPLRPATGVEWVKTSRGQLPRARASQFSKSLKVFHVSKVVDGDTMHLAELPNHAKVRLLGVDTPETKHVVKGIQFWGPEASAFTKKILSDVDVVVHVDPKNQYGVFGRSLVFLELLDGRDFNALLVSGGFARVTKEYKFSRMSAYLKLEEKARAAGLGMWNKAGRAAFDVAKRAAEEAERERLAAAQRKELARRETLVAEAVKAGGRYISSSTSKSVHEPWCKRRPRKRVRHIKSLEEALGQGLKKHHCFRK